MKKLDIKEFNKLVKRNYVALIIGLLFLISSILLFYLGYNNEHKKIENAVSMNSLISSDVKEENKKAYIDVNIVPYSFAVYETDGVEDDNKFYLLMDKNNFLYIVYMDNDDFNKLNREDIETNPIRIIGTTKLISEDIKELAISSYNEVLKDEYLTDENFSEYVGYILLDTVTPLNDSSLYYIMASILLFTSVMLIIKFITFYIQIKKIFKKYQNELDKISSEIYSLNPNPYDSFKLYLTKNYLVDMSCRLIILKYEDVIWAYPHEYRYNGLLINKCVRLETKDKKIYDIANSKNNKAKDMDVTKEILDLLKNKNKDILIGYTKENKQMIKEMRKSKS